MANQGQEIRPADGLENCAKECWRMRQFPTVHHRHFLHERMGRSVALAFIRVGRTPALCRGIEMSINKDQVEGRVKEAAGKVQEVAGKTLGSSKQEIKGTINKTAGAVQAKFGDVKSDLKDANRQDQKR
jgi:uncharacterized protein YjbJ (UPF0337 family)